ncbi:MAG TPA: hypothetical protein VJL29_01540 [Thermoguttaceae bacterium]|nr:hypothetical protein [Thermoguttaceae bacterium]
MIRKIVYISCLLPLVVTLYWLGHPATLDTETAKGSSGGVLARYRDEEDLTQVYLGKIDPTSATLRLATLGMQGVAADILWIKNINYQKKKDWTNVSATLNQIIKLQPNFIDVWRNQGWNLSYNCSAEFDDYRERYHWVIKGIDFLKLGTTYNRREPRLLRDIAWFISQKIGRSDEREQFRRLFKEDDEFNGPLPKSERDNWLVGKRWFRKAENLIDTEDIPTRGMNPVVFRSEAAMCQMNYGVAIEQEGVFGERARMAWRQAAKDWDDFGQYEMPTSDGRLIRLGNLDRLAKERQALLDELDRLAPGVRKQLYDKRYAGLGDEYRKALKTPTAARTSEQQSLAAEAEALLLIEPREVVRHPNLPRDNRTAANAVLEKIQRVENLARVTQSYRSIVNYDYWERRADIEQMDAMLAARELVYQGGKALAEGDLAGATEAFARGSVLWAAVLRENPMLMSDSATIDDMEELLQQYGKALDQRDSLFPPDFALAPFVRFQVYDSTEWFQIRAMLDKAAQAERKGDPSAASSQYLKAIQSWRSLLNDLPSVEQRSDPGTTAMILETIEKYAAVLHKLKQPIPSDFLLHRFVRIQVEHDPDSIESQAALEKAETAMEKEPAAARTAFERAFALWRVLLDRYPTLLADGTVGEEWMAAIDEYRDLLKREKADLSKDFPLQDVVDRYGQPEQP